MSNKTELKQTIYRVTMVTVFLVYLIYLFYLVFFSHQYGRDTYHGTSNLIPFRTIYNYLRAPCHPRVVFINIVGNIVAFLPMGFFLPLIFKKMRKATRLLISVTLVTTIIETGQLISGVGAFDIDDIILNIIGGFAGFLMYRFYNYLTTN
ncbi:VanZ family protein [Halothermothrix orenii]|uniref:VanZ family protein n=1 Tax=Halothermothrix orenii (strain H 168 / OCM 544 / DSM 9562) TaxID=373903 RepID=B8CWB9_HALOH|nr:VanZ family protein [Halothermothrix orenii]ACL69588.1 VanZ family protein [Halothermothrix orenii H 168]